PPQLQLNSPPYRVSLSEHVLYSWVLIKKTLRGKNMARRAIHMNEVMEILYHWHQGASIKGITRSLGYDRKTVRRYVRAAEEVGLKRDDPFPDEQEICGKLKALLE